MFDLENFCASIARSICHWRHYAVDKSVCVLTSTSSFLTFFLLFVLTVSRSSKIQIGFTFLVPAYPGCPGKEAVKWLLLLLLLFFRESL